MIGPISNDFVRDVGGFSRLSSLFPSSTDPASAAALGGGPSTRPTQSTGDISFLQITQQISQMLKSVGGGLENDQTLQMVIGLLILMAMMSQSQRTHAPAADLSNLSAQAGRGTAISAYSSYTSISITSAEMSFTASASETYAAISSPAQTQQPRFDLQA